MDAAAATALLDLAEQASAASIGPDAREALDELETRSDELRSALDWFLDAGRTDDALRLANAMYRYWITKQGFVEGAAWFERVLAAPGGDPLLRGRACLSAGMMPFWMGDDQRARELFDEALEAGRQL